MIRKTLLPLMALLAGFAAPLPAQTARPNLLENRGFETASPALQGWARVPPTAPAGSHTRDSAVFHGGSASAKVYNNSSVNGPILLSQVLPAYPGRTYYASGWLKTSLASGQAFFQLRFKNSTGAVLQTRTFGTASGTQDWTYSQTSGTTPSNAFEIAFETVLQSPLAVSTARFDDVFLDNGSDPVYIWTYGHHYMGGGGTYSSTVDILEFSQICADRSVPATFFTDGIAAGENPIEDAAFASTINARGHDIGYHGDETHGPFPTGTAILSDKYGGGAEFLAKGAGWDAAVADVIEKYSHRQSYVWVDPTANPRHLDVNQGGVVDPTQVGGVTLVQQLYGRDPDSATVQAVECAPCGYAFRLLLPDLVFSQAGAPIAVHVLQLFGIPQYIPDAARFGGSDHNLVWRMGLLHSKEIEQHGMIVTSDGRQHLDRSYPRVSPIAMGADTPNSTKNNFTASLDRQIAEFLPFNPCSHWISSRGMVNLVEPENGRAITATDLHDVAASLDTTWNNRPPDYFDLGGSPFSGDERHFSAADAIQAFAGALAYYARAGSLPASVGTEEILGPIGEPGTVPHTDGADIPVAEIVSASAPVLDAVANDVTTYRPRRVPWSITVGSRALNPAEFLIAAARAYLAIESGAGSPVAVPPSDVLPPWADTYEAIFGGMSYNQPQYYSKLQLWTVKPARYRSYPHWTGTAGITSITDNSACNSPSVQLRWDGASACGSVTYDLLRSERGDGQGAATLATGLTAVAWTDTSAACGRTYWYSITAQGDGRPATSPWIQATPLCDGQAPGAVTSLLAAGSLNDVSLTWTAPPDPDIAGYRIYRSTAPQQVRVSANLLGQSATASYNDPSLNDGINYYYQVVAVDACGTEGPP